MMRSADLVSLRKTLTLTQVEMADRIGLGSRAYQELESGASRLRPIHVRAAERAALTIAVERGNPMLAPAGVRREALALAALITGV